MGGAPHDVLNLDGILFWFWKAQIRRPLAMKNI